MRASPPDDMVATDCPLPVKPPLLSISLASYRSPLNVSFRSFPLCYSVGADKFNRSASWKTKWLNRFGSTCKRRRDAFLKVVRTESFRS